MEPNDYYLIRTADELRREAETLSQQPVIGFDCETTSLDPYGGRMRLVQLAAPDGVRLIDLDSFADGDARRAEALEPLRQLLAAPRPIKIAHNAKFDAKWTKHYLGVELGGVFDTLLASQIVSAGDTDDRHSLEVVAARYLNETIDKSEQLSDWGGELSGSQLEYAARDAAVMLPLREKLIERLKANDLVRCAALEFECVMPVACLELAGVFLDEGRWREQMVIVEKRRAILAEELQNMLSEGTVQGSLFENARAHINIDSHTQLTAELKRLGVPVPDSTRNWKLQPLAADYPVVAKLLEYRTVQKSLTSYGANILDEINPATGRIHANFHQIGAPTGRFACLAGDTLVPTLNGFRQMDTIKQGDQVKTSYGFKKVQKAWMTGVRQLYRMQLRDGRSIRATADHRFLAGRGDTWKQLDELRPGDAVFVSLKASTFEQRARPFQISVLPSNVRSRKQVTLPEELSPELCELIGLIIADGFLGRRHERPAPTRGRLGGGTPATYDRVLLAFNRQDSDLIQRVIEHGRNLFGQPFASINARTCHVLQFASTTVAEFFAGLGLTGNAHTKAVPEIIMSAPLVFQAAFLRGLFEGDGHRTNNSVGLTSVNRRLLSQVQLMLSEFGIYSIVKARTDASGFSVSVRFNLSICKKTDLVSFSKHIGFISQRKNRPFEFAVQNTDGIPTPFVISGTRHYSEAVAAGTTPSSREGVKPFAHFYKGLHIKGESVQKLIGKFGMLPSLRPVANYLDMQLRPVVIESVTPDGVEEVYDITVEDVHEFIANGIIVHNCTSPNIQQVPHAVEYRRCFRAPEGRKLLIADYSQIELRILAHITEDQGFIDAFNSGADLHRVTAAQVFKTPLDQVTKEQRDFAKRLNFGVVYGIGAQRFSMMTGISLADSEEILRRYFSTYRALDTWLRAAAQRAIRERTARTLSGRLARFKFDSEDRQAASLAQRNGKNMPVQGSSADILKRALRLLHDKIKDTSARIVNIVHDEIVVEVDAGDAEAVAKTIEEAMCAAGEEYVTRVPIKVETEIADEWVK
ncbi:MAG: DNA polymerase [Acidobacteriota bacterium]|nr:DNA polymerase [Acidobacteriota bacterium]